MKPRVGIGLSVLVGLAAALIGLSAVVGGGGCALFQSEQVSKGQKLYAHYCMHCHGEHGRQNEGYNWGMMPDPRPKDLSAKEEMSTFKDEEIFETVSRDMKDTTPEVGDEIGDDEFAVPTMPTFKYTLSEEEIWAIVAYVRTLHGMKLQMDVAAQKKALEDALQKAQQALERTQQVAEAKAQPVADAGGASEPAGRDARSPEQVALEQAERALANFTARPKPSSLPRPDLTMSEQEAAKQAELGKRLYTNKYGCNGCHQVGEEGGVVGPALDRAGFRLNPTWIYRWIKYPQSMKPETRMPNLGISDPDAKAIAMYLGALRAPRPDKPIEKAAN